MDQWDKLAGWLIEIIIAILSGLVDIGTMG